MAADDELQRGWYQTAQAGSTNEPSITFPAIPGIGWVLTHIDFVLWGAAGATAEIVLVNGGQLPAVAGDDGGAGATGVASWDGQISYPQNTAVVVQGSGAGANRFANLGARAYPV